MRLAELVARMEKWEKTHTFGRLNLREKTILKTQER